MKSVLMTAVLGALLAIPHMTFAQRSTDKLDSQVNKAVSKAMVGTLKLTWSLPRYNNGRNELVTQTTQCDKGLLVPGGVITKITCVYPKNFRGGTFFLTDVSFTANGAKSQSLSPVFWRVGPVSMYGFFSNKAAQSLPMKWGMLELTFDGSRTTMDRKTKEMKSNPTVITKQSPAFMIGSEVYSNVADFKKMLKGAPVKEAYFVIGSEQIKLSNDIILGMGEDWTIAHQ